MTRLLIAPLGLIAAVALASACGGEEESPAGTPTEGARTPAPSPPTATVAAAPTATQQVYAPVWSVSQLTEGSDVVTVLSDGANEYRMASVDAESAQFEFWNAVFDTDLDGDGVNEVIVSHYTGGAHCCSEYLIFRSGPEGIEALDGFSLGNGGLVEVSDLDGDGVPELQGLDDRLAYFDDLPYVVSQVLPLVLCRADGGTYVDCTPAFAELLLAGADSFEQALSEALAADALEEETRALALAVLASYSRLGMDDQGWSLVDAACPDCGDWLRLNLAELEERIAFAQPFREH